MECVNFCLDRITIQGISYLQGWAHIVDMPEDNDGLIGPEALRADDPQVQFCDSKSTTLEPSDRIYLCQFTNQGISYLLV